MKTSGYEVDGLILTRCSCGRCCNEKLIIELNNEKQEWKESSDRWFRTSKILKDKVQNLECEVLSLTPIKERK